MTTSITNSSWIEPNLPGSLGFDSSIPSDNETAFDGSGYIDKLKNGIAKITATQDPQVIQGVLAYIINLTSGQDPKINVADVESFIDNNLNGSNGFVQTAALQGVEAAFFLGYTNTDGVTASGETGAQNYINDMIASLGGPNATSTSKYANQMILSLEGLNTLLPQFTDDHTDANGNLIWTYGGSSSGSGVTYTWNTNGDPTTPNNDNFYIWNIIKGNGPQGTPNPLFSDLASNFGTMQYNWRMIALQQLLISFKDPSIALSLWMTSAYDNQYQSNIYQLATTTNSLTLQTNSFATPLLQEINGFSSIDATGAKTFVSTLLNWNTYVTTNVNSSSIASSLQTNTIGAILNTNIDDPASTTTPKGQITLVSFLQNISNGVSGYTYTTLATSLSALTAAPTSTTSGGTTTLSNSSSPSYLAMVNAAQAGGQLVTETSKTTATQLQQISDLDNAVIKFGSSMADPVNGSGPLALQAKIVANQRVSG